MCEEFSDVVKHFDSVCKKLNKNLLDSIYLSTARHAGAVSEYLDLICKVGAQLPTATTANSANKEKVHAV